MAKHFVTFGQVHTHSINGKTLDKDTIAVFEAETYAQGRKRTHELFGNNFFTDYHGEFPEDSLQYFPKGFVNIG